jgi:hypothetical protein
MKRKLLVMFLLLAFGGLFALAAGCTSPGAPAGQTNITPVATPLVFTPDLLEDLLLLPADLPEGYQVVYRGEMAPGNASCAADICYVTGYFTSAANGEGNTTTSIDQAVTIYNKNVNQDNLLLVLSDQLPDIVTSANLTLAGNPGLGDASATYMFTLPISGTPVKGYLVVFGKGNLYEVVMVVGPDATESLAMEMAGKAAGKLP